MSYYLYFIVLRVLPNLDRRVRYYKRHVTQWLECRLYAWWPGFISLLCYFTLRTVASIFLICKMGTLITPTS